MLNTSDNGCKRTSFDTFSRSVLIAALAFAPLYSASSQTSNDLALKQESLAEQQTDLAILKLRWQNNRNEYSIQPFCNVKLADPIQNARKTYCNQKGTEFTNKDADLRAQVEKLQVSIQQLQAEILQLQRTQPQKR